MISFLGMGLQRLRLIQEANGPLELQRLFYPAPSRDLEEYPIIVCRFSCASAISPGTILLVHNTRFFHSKQNCLSKKLTFPDDQCAFTMNFSTPTRRGL